MKKNISNVNIRSQNILDTPQDIKTLLPATTASLNTVINSRKILEDILDRKDRRLILIVGPCSIHDPIAAMDYAEKLKNLAEEVSDHIFVVMRMYFEKPRTTTGWKGLINDPHLDDSFDIQAGIKTARELLIKINEIGLPAGTEALDPISPQYLGDLISWSAIGARTTESQTHREMASGLSTPVGFKNGTDGTLSTAVNALLSVSKPHSFLGINQDGQIAVIKTIGNRYGHAVLRGGNNGPNYDKKAISSATKQLEEKGLPANIIIDCSHANSEKTPENQSRVLTDCLNQISDGNTSIVGFMLESHLKSGRQSIPPKVSDLTYGISITDGCIGWETTEKLIRDTKDKLNKIRNLL